MFLLENIYFAHFFCSENLFLKHSFFLLQKFHVSSKVILFEFESPFHNLIVFLFLFFLSLIFFFLFQFQTAFLKVKFFLLFVFQILFFVLCDLLKVEIFHPRFKSQITGVDANVITRQCRLILQAEFNFPLLFCPFPKTAFVTFCFIKIVQVF